MKKLCSLAIALLSFITLAIAQPQKMTYQSVVRNSNNELVVNHQVGVRVSILEDSVNGPMIYRETHTPTTNANGLVTIMIGDGIHPYTNTLDDVNWDSHTHFLSIEIDPLGGTNYTILGTQQLVSVPYAFYAGGAKSVDTALYAATALHADTAYYLANFTNTDTVMFAYHSDTASYAYNANNANNAANAQHSDTALYAHNANNAVNANYATSAGTAITAASALYADSTSVANYANSADYNNLQNKPIGMNKGDILYWNPADTSWHIVPAGNSGEVLTMDTNSVPYWGGSVVNLPQVSTDSVINVTGNSANAVGTVTNDGGSALVMSGICWSLSQNPTTNDSHTLDGIGVGSFISSITGLNVVTTYHVRAFATNTAGTAYGSDIQFTTPAVLPTVTTALMSNIMGLTATSGGDVIDDGGATVTSRGICWSTMPNPTISDSTTTNGNGLGVFTSNMSNLSMGTIYYVRAYAVNSVGVAYGNEVIFTTLSIPSVTTNIASNITSTTAVSGGTVISDGGALVTVRGVCYSTSPNPSTADSVTNDGLGIGAFTSNIASLSPGTTYYVRAYAINVVGIAYGNEGSFTTPAVLPIVTTTAVSNIMKNSASSGGDVTYDGGASITGRGVCWSTSHNPTTANSHTSDSTGTGVFVSSLTGLNPQTTYYVRAYAINSVGTAYGNEETFTSQNVCGGDTSVTDIDNNTYGIVAIGTQCWMKENLRTTRYPNGALIATGYANTSSSTGYYYHIMGNSGNDAVYGLAYNWVAAMNGEAQSNSIPSGVQGVCPNGWHLPSKAEVDILINFVTGDYGCSASQNGKPLAADENWNSDGGNCTIGNDISKNNSSGFSMQPAGHVLYDGNYNDFGNQARMWTSTEVSSNKAYYLWFANYEDHVHYNEWSEYFYSYSVRCIKNDSPAPDGQPCPDAPDVTDADNNTYNTVLIGSQCWMKENLRTTKYPKGDDIDEGLGQSTSTGYYYHVNGDGGNDAVYGLLYNWVAAMDGGASSDAIPGKTQGICPDGWHMPSVGDFEVLRNYVKGQYGCDNLYDGRPLAAGENWSNCAGNCKVGDDLSANDSSGFSMQPAGWFNGGSYSDFESYARIWTSQEENSNYAHYLSLRNCDTETDDSYEEKYHGYSIRCLKNDYVSNWRKCTGTPTVTDVDGNTYNTVQIGAQCWMKENLRTTQYANGNPIDEGYAQTSSYTGYYYHVNDNSGNDNTYGLLYNWAAAMHETADEGTQGVCPDGWHLPSRAEFQKLRNYFNGDHGCDNLYDGKPLAADANWYSCNNGDCNIGNDIATNNTTGFSLQPAGWADGSSYNDFRSQARLWASTEENPDNARFLWFETCRDDSWDWDEQKHHAYSVRCIKDNAVACPGIPTVTDDEGNTYHTILIGSQCWMRENLRTTVYNDGETPIDNGESDPTSDINGYYYHVDGDPDNDGVYGLLYNWAAAMNYDYSEGTRGICPSGWHIPSSDECNELLSYVRGDDDCDDWQNGRPLAADDNWDYCPADCHIGYDLSSNNSTGFSIQPAGWFDGNFNDFRYQARIWSSTEEWSNRARYLHTENCYSDVLNNDEEKQHGYSVRCIKD